MSTLRSSLDIQLLNLMTDERRTTWPSQWNSSSKKASASLKWLYRCEKWWKEKKVR